MFPLLKAKRTYEQKCRDVDTAEENLKKSVAASGKDEERVSICMIGLYCNSNGEMA